MSSINLIQLKDLIKSVVKEHTRKTRSGKVSQVRQHEDKRTKKTVESKSKGMSSGLSSIVNEVAKHDSVKSAYTAFKHRTGIPREVADEFFQKFGEGGKLDPEDAFKNLYNHAKGISDKGKSAKPAATAKKKGKAKEDPKKKSGKKSAPVGENGYDTWYDTEDEANQAMSTMKKEGLNPAYVAQASQSSWGSLDSVLKFKIYRSQEELAKVNAASRAKGDAIKAAKKKEEDAKLDVDGFGADLKPMNRTKAVTALNKQIRANGKITTLKDFVRESVKAGKELSIEEVGAIKPMSRTKFNRASGREQELHEKKMKAAGTKKVYYVDDYNLGKTAYDYAVYLKNKKLKKSLPASLLLIKSRVKGHTRRTRSGKVVNVKEHTDSRRKTATPKKKTAPEYRGHAEEIRKQIGSGAMFMMGGRANPGPTYRVLNNVNGIQADQLHETIEQNTGLYLSMGNMRGR